MGFMQINNLLRYNVTNVRHQLHISHGNISCEQNLATHTKKTTMSQLHIETERSQLQIDNTAFRESIGLKSIMRLLDDAAVKGKQAALEFAGTRAREGEYLNHIEKGHNFAQLARQKYFQRFDGKLEVSKAAHVDISFTKSDIRMQFTPMQQQFTFDTSDVQRTYTPPKFELEILQHPSITYDYLGQPIIAAPQTAQKMNLRV